MTPSDYLRDLGPLALSLRLRRLSDRLLEGGRKIYAASRQELEPNWYAHLLLLAEHGPLTITEIADALGQKHPSVIETARRLEHAGLVSASRDPEDGRRRLLALSRAAHERWPAFQRLWDAFGAELTALIADGPTDLMPALDSLDAALAECSLEQRVLRRLDTPRPEISPRRQPAKAEPAIRETEAGDRDGVLHIARELVRSADTYAYSPDVSDDELWRYWSPEASGGDGFVAIHDERVVGAFVIRPNHPGPGSHVANASYAVRADVRGLGVGRRMGEASLELARGLGFRAMQFNIVIGTNSAAVRLWKSLGFRIIGTVPDGFRLPSGELTSHHIMYRSL